jgi:two-component system sensor histidine kinase ChvG
MLEKVKAPAETERVEPEETPATDDSVQSTEQTQEPPQSWIGRLTPASLIARIFLINLLGLLILALGTLYFNQFRQSLIDARAQSLRTQAQIIAAALAGSATVDTGSIVVNPDSLDDAPETLEDGELPEGLDFPINPETASPVLRRLLGNTSNRAQVIDPQGNLVVDSRYFFGSDTIEILPNDGTRPAEESGRTWWDQWLDWMLGSDYPNHVDYGLDGNDKKPEIAAALNGANVSLVRLDDKREIIVVVTVPIQRFRAVLGALVLSNAGGEIDSVLRAERRVVLLTFGLATLVSLLLSALLAATIANPIRKLSDAARKVRQGVSKRVEVPDFSSRKDEIGRLSASMRGMTSALYNRIDAIEAFAADVAHELKNPLTSLRSAVETLTLVKTDEQRERLIDIVIQDVRRMDRLITDISDASRLDAELARTESQPVDLGRLLGAIVSMSNELGKEEEPEVILTIEPPEAGKTLARTYTITGQDSRLSQVFRNLIDNARSFTAPGTKINVRMRHTRTHIEVRVEDRGPGVRPENLDRIFERFYTDRPDQSFGNNSGLGLAISRQIVEAHGGRIWAENRKGKATVNGEAPVLGARLIVRLPLREAPTIDRPISRSR